MMVILSYKILKLHFALVFAALLTFIISKYSSFVYTKHEHQTGHSLMTHIYLLGKGGYVFGSVGLSVCLFVNNITQKVVNGLG